MSNTLGHRLRPALQTGLTATGSSQATAFPLTNNTLHEFTTVAASTGAILPVGVTPSEVTIYNSGASTLTLYPPMGGSIDAGSANASVSLAAGSGVTLWASTPSNWYYLVTPGTGGGGGTPGGSNGQLQINSDGSFGGVPNLIAPSTGPPQYLGGPFINITGPGTAVANTTTPASLFTGATFRSGQSLTIPANSLIAGDEIEITLWGTFGVAASNPRLTITVLLGSTVVMSSTNGGMAATATNGQWVLGAAPTRIWFPQVGSSGGCSAYGSWNGVLSASTESVQGFGLFSGAGLGTGSLIALDTTIAHALDVQVAWSVADPASTIQLLGGTIKKSG
jgi:hypothetical protein